MRVRVKGINKVTKRLADGSLKVHYYYRRTGKRVEGMPGSAEFLASYAEAVRHGTKQEGAPTFDNIIVDYLKSSKFVDLSPKSQKDYRRFIGLLRVAFGSMPVAALEDVRVRGNFFEWRDKFAGSPRTADYAFSVLRLILEWAYDNGRIGINHAIRPKRLYQSDRADKTWDLDHVARFCGRASIELQQALMLAAYTGQRQGDLLRLSWTRYDGDWINIRQGKTGRRVDIPVHRDLRMVLDRVERRAATILTSKSGMPWKEDHFRHEWRKATLWAGLDGLHFHDLRGTAVTHLQDAGCTDREIAAITGHKGSDVSRILDDYAATNRKAATSAMQKWENTERTGFANQMQTGPSPPSSKGAK